MNKLLDQLKSLGVELGAEKTEFKQREKLDLPALLGGEWLETPYGRTLHIQQDLELNAVQGKIPLQCTKIASNVLELFNISHVLEESTISPTRICFFDTETSGLNIGSGTFVFLSGFSHFMEDGSVRVDQFFLPHPSEEKAFIHAVQEFLTRYSILSSYNGKGFDVPMLRSRFILNDMEDDGLEKTHLDLLFLARSLWKRRLASCRLVEIEESILHFSRSGQDVPGWLVPILYQDYLREGKAEPLKDVLYHNAQDVISLAALFNVIHAMLNDERETYNIEETDDFASLGYLYEKLRKFDLSASYFRTYFAEKGNNAAPEVLYDYAWMQRRQENWSEALTYWQRAASQAHYPSMIELAKYYEHQAKDLEQALFWTKKVQDAGKIEQDMIVKDDIRKRKDRLDRKYGNKTNGRL